MILSAFSKNFGSNKFVASWRRKRRLGGSHEKTMAKASMHRGLAVFGWQIWNEFEVWKTPFSIDDGLQMAAIGRKNSTEAVLDPGG